LTFSVRRQPASAKRKRALQNGSQIAWPPWPKADGKQAFRDKLRCCGAIMAIPWHRIFGMALTQYFAGSDWQVDVEVDLSLQQQRLDLVVLRRKGPGTPPRLPDGFGTPADYNLFTFKALNDPLGAFALKELAGHSVNYRKQISPNPDALLPESDFRLLAATMRYPRQLASQVTLQRQGPGA
jgi:hypothetical protein